MENEENTLDVYHSNEEDTEEKEIPKNVVQGEAFRKLQKKAKRLGAKSFDIQSGKTRNILLHWKAGKRLTSEAPSMRIISRTKMIKEDRNI